MITRTSSRSRFERTMRAGGFTLLIAVIFTSVVLSVALALSDVAYRQVVLASTARQSQYAFYAADSGLECVLYWDQKRDTFDYTTEPVGSVTGVTCQGQTVSVTAAAAASGSRTTTVTIPCTGGGSQASATIYKQSTGATKIDVSGYNSCSTSDQSRVERGLKASY